MVLARHRCQVRASEAIGVATACEGVVEMRSSYCGGLNDFDLRAISSFDLAGSSRVTASACELANTVCGGSGARALEAGLCVLRGCNLSNHSFGIGVDHLGEVDAEGCTFNECIWGSFYVGFAAKKTRIRLVNCTVPDGPGWYDERRPGRLEEVGNLVNDTRLVPIRDWQEYAKGRFKAGHRDGWLERHIVTGRGGEGWRMGHSSRDVSYQ